MKVKNIYKVEEERGVASTLVAKEVVPAYNEQVAKFLTDNQSRFGDKWVKNTASKLYIFGENKDGELVGSSTYGGLAMATFLPEVSLIRGRELLELQKNSGDKTPLGSVYIDFGVQVNGNPKNNKAQAEALQADYKTRGFSKKEIYVPDFSQLRLNADDNGNLVAKLADDTEEKDLTPLSAYDFCHTGNNGLFRAYLNGDGNWNACNDYLSNSDDSGRVVRYDAAGVEPKKIESQTSELVSELGSQFLGKFKLD